MKEGEGRLKGQSPKGYVSRRIGFLIPRPMFASQKKVSAVPQNRGAFYPERGVLVEGLTVPRRNDAIGTQ